MNKWTMLLCAGPLVVMMGCGPKDPAATDGGTTPTVDKPEDTNKPVEETKPADENKATETTPSMTEEKTPAGTSPTPEKLGTPGEPGASTPTTGK